MRLYSYTKLNAKDQVQRSIQNTPTDPFSRTKYAKATIGPLDSSTIARLIRHRFATLAVVGLWVDESLIGDSWKLGSRSLGAE